MTINEEIENTFKWFTAIVGMCILGAVVIRVCIWIISLGLDWSQAVCNRKDICNDTAKERIVE